MLTRIFKSGNSMAVRIPKEIAFDAGVPEVEIERRGEVVSIRPAKRKSLAGVMRVFASFSPDFMADGRAARRQKERDWAGPAQG